jgi:hypothetical protein
VIDIARYLASSPRGVEFKENGNRGEWRSTCPFHTSPRANPVNFSVNAETGFWLCRSPICGMRGSFPLLYKLLEGIASWADVKKKLGARSPLSGWQDLQFTSRQDRASEINYQDLPPSVFHDPITPGNFPAYLSNTRKYDESLCNLGFDLRWCKGGDYRNRILFPFYDLEGKLLTFTGRLMSDSDTNLRYRFPENASTSQFLYGVHRINLAKKLDYLWVCEGQFDVLRLATLGEYAVGISKGVISDRQILDVKRICKLYGAEAIACLDKGAFDATQKIWTELVSIGTKAHAVDISDIAKDPDGLDMNLLSELKSQISRNKPSIWESFA